MLDFEAETRRACWAMRTGDGNEYLKVETSADVIKNLFA